MKRDFSMNFVTVIVNPCTYRDPMLFIQLPLSIAQIDLLNLTCIAPKFLHQNSSGADSF